MHRNLRILLSLALVAVVATAEMAQAQPFFRSNLEETTITATPDGAVPSATAHHVFDIVGGGTVTCREIKIHGTAKAAAIEEITLIPEYSEKDSGGATNCTFVGQAVKVHTGQCAFVIHASGGVAIEDREGKSCNEKPIELTLPTCTVKIGKQTGLTGLTYRNIEVGGIKEITASANVAGISGEEVGAGCPAPGAFTTGLFTTGNTIITGAKAGEPTKMTNIEWRETAEPLFHSELTATTITSTADGVGATAHHVFDAAGSSLTCSGASFHGVQTGREVNQLMLAAEYSSCTFLGKATTVSTTGCAFVFHADGKVDITNRAGKNCGTEPIKFSISGCKIEIGSQSGLQEATFKTSNRALSKKSQLKCTSAALDTTPQARSVQNPDITKPTATTQQATLFSQAPKNPTRRKWRISVGPNSSQALRKARGRGNPCPRGDCRATENALSAISATAASSKALRLRNIYGCFRHNGSILGT